MRPAPLTLVRLLVAALLGLAAQAGHAVTALSIFGGCGVYGDSGAFGECRIPYTLLVDPGHGAALGEGDGVTGLFAGSANAQGYAHFGALGAGVNATAYNSASGSAATLGNHSAAAQIAVDFGDTLTFSALGLTGQKGTVYVKWRFDGGGGTFVGGPAPVMAQGSAMSLSLSIDTPYASFTQDRNLNTNPDHPEAMSVLLAPIMLAIPVVFGQPTFVHASLSVRASAHAGVPALSPDDPGYLMTRSAGAYANLMHTAAWDGVDQVVDAQGQVVSGWAVASETGTDYRFAISAVPEPAAWALLLVGLAWVAPRRPRGPA